MADKKQEALLSQLFDLTEADRITWQETSEENTFAAMFSEYVITISEKEEIFDRASYEFTIRNKEGRVIDEIDGNAFDPDWQSLFERLFTKARRQVAGAEQALNSILDELSKLKDDPEDIPF
ncbi:MAG: hypothetical protein AAGD11_08995 [Planctomycetota bacterium]